MLDPYRSFYKMPEPAGVVLAISLLYGASIAGGIVVTSPGPAAGVWGVGGSRGLRV